LQALKKLFKKKQGRGVYVSTDTEVFNRYIHSLVFSIRSANQPIYYYAAGNSLKDIDGDMYAAMAFKNVTIAGKNHDRRHLLVTLSDRKKLWSSKLLSNNYFVPSRKASYHVPILQHPMMYEKGHWNRPIIETERNRSLILIGTFSDVYTEEICSTFDIADRRAIRSNLENVRKHQIEYLPQDLEHKIIIIDSSSNEVKRPNLRQTLYCNYFFMALPGCVMPHAHNLAEALSVGCIPIIEAGYARRCHPPLEDGVNAIVFKDIEELNERVEFAFSQSKVECDRLSRGALTYYDNYMHPQKVAEGILNSKNKSIFLCAEHQSVIAYKRYLKKRRYLKKIFPFLDAK
jgi:hypothetical protein